MPMGAASEVARRIAHVDPYYRAIVMALREAFESGRYNRMLLLDAVLLAEERREQDQALELLRNPPGVKACMSAEDVADWIRANNYTHGPVAATGSSDEPIVR